ncbi:hypothetical protein CK203_007929 [Vitis vinifera]|uniref:Uncharacterized protein n=1 Tax=Vitis vinifera TaxID=29760 RepID=A0A438K160_VITVI|nr:hypothetical protein CK203_007929 [Vitis vinifera]
MKIEGKLPHNHRELGGGAAVDGAVDCRRPPTPVSKSVRVNNKMQFLGNETPCRRKLLFLLQVKMANGSTGGGCRAIAEAQMVISAMAVTGFHLVAFSSSPNALFPPQSPISSKDDHHQQKQEQKQLQSSLFGFKTYRRDAALLSFLALIPGLHRSSPATALTFGISGPKDWLKGQKRKASKFLLAPVDASRESLRTAYLLFIGLELIAASGSNDPNKDLEEVQRLLKSAARDCVPQERNSFVAFQATTGVEVCTFRLILKNAASLLDDKDPVKLEAEAMLNDLISSFTSLDDVTNETDMEFASKRFIATSDSYAMSQIIDVTGDATPPNMSFGFDKLVML